VAVDGDVRVGVGGNPDTGIKDLGAAIAGFKYSMREEEPLPYIAAPASLASVGSAITAKGKTVVISPADNGTYTGVSLKSDSQPGVLEISGGDVELHITGDIELGQLCEVVVKDGSSLTLYVDGVEDSWTYCDLNDSSNDSSENAPPAVEAHEYLKRATGVDFGPDAVSEFLNKEKSPEIKLILILIPCEENFMERVCIRIRTMAERALFQGSAIRSWS